MTLPPPVLERRGRLLVVRDDLLPGGTKRRAIPALLTGGAEEYVYASPAQGYAQIALAHACRDAGKQATIFVAKRKQLHPRTAAAKAAGARVVQVPHGYLSNVQAKAKSYAEATGAALLPFGLNDPAFIAELARVARGLPVQPEEVWTVAGSGTLTRALQLAWPAASFVAVVVGSTPDVGRARAIRAPERYEQRAADPPPFPSCDNYDAKAWQFIRCSAAPGALFWNVGA